MRLGTPRGVLVIPATFLVGLASLTVPPGAVGAAAPSLVQRVAAQRAIEQVYWRHRLWPEQNRTVKPPLSVVLSDGAIQARTEDALRKSAALERFWQWPITAVQLAAEVRRMVAQSQKPDVLRELFAALGNDPTLIAECLARPLLADRLVRHLYGSDERFHGAGKALAEAQRKLIGSIADMRHTRGAYEEIEWQHSTSPLRHLAHRSGDARIVPLSGSDWNEKRAELRRAFGVDEGGALPVGVMSAVLEDQERFFVTAVISADETRVRTATATWRKVPFDAWWAGVRGDMPLEASSVDATMTLPELPVACTDDTWAPMPQGLPGARYGHSAVWTGSEMIVWGGDPFTNTGARYDPVTDTWTATSTVNAPAPRGGHGAVWTGSEMIVWGLSSGGNVDPASGGRYNPTTDTWVSTNTSGAPSARSSFTTIWTGSHMVVWGGHGCVDPPTCSVRGDLNTGGAYDPATDSWLPTSTATAPAPREMHTAVWTGSRMIVWGGWGCQDPPACTTRGKLDTGGSYDPGNDSWTATTTTGAPSARGGHTAVWTSSDMIIWGATSDQTGGRYDPIADHWAATSLANASPARVYHTAVWTGTEMVVWGGVWFSVFYQDGARYDPSADTWTPTSTSNAPSPRSLHTAVWTGTEIIVVGGYDNTLTFDNGGRYSPGTDSWLPTSATFSPIRRFEATAVWTGAEMIVWGGNGFANPGGRYDPATGAWTPTATIDAPTGDTGLTAVWTGTEMLVWGGSSTAGGRYDPTGDTWTPTSPTNAPVARYDYAAVWTGSEMVVWGGDWSDTGGEHFENTGGRYDPLADAWSPTTTLNAPIPRARATGVWTGSDMIVWGGYWHDSSGYPSENTGGIYDPVADAWRPTSTAGAPSPRDAQTAIWTGQQMVVWGGGADASGGKYDPASDTWVPTSLIGAPSVRALHTSVWTGGEMLVWGGFDGSQVLGDGGRYVPLSDSWTPISTVGSPAPRSWHVGVWDGTEMLVWGGITFGDGTGFLGDGGRYCASARGVISVAPSPLDFGRVVIGTTTMRTLTVSNLGSASLPVFSVSLPGAPFAKTGDACTGQTLVPAATCAVTLTVTPTALGQFSSQVQVGSGDANSPTVTVSLHAQSVDVLMTPTALAIDDSAGDGNGILEPGELAALVPSWRNDGIDTALGVSGSLSSSDPITLLDASASYGDIAPGVVRSCTSLADCYVVQPDSLRPSQHWDIVVHEALSTGDGHDWVLHVGNSFADVPTTQWAYRFIETIFHHGITAGCDDGDYCPGAPVSRWQMAVFLAKAMTGGDVPVSGAVPGMGAYDCVPGPVGVSVFSDVTPGDPGCRFIHYIAAQAITAGCGGDAYCPTDTIDRWQMAVLLAKAMSGGDVPVSGTVPGMGPYNCIAGGTSVFADVSPADPGCRHIHYVAAQGVTAGCGGGDYCPAIDLGRDQMAVFMSKGFHLGLYGP